MAKNCRGQHPKAVKLAHGPAVIVAGATIADADLDGVGNQVGMHNCSRQPIASPAGVVR